MDKALANGLGLTFPTPTVRGPESIHLPALFQLSFFVSSLFLLSTGILHLNHLRLPKRKVVLMIRYRIMLWTQGTIPTFFDR